MAPLRLALAFLTVLPVRVADPAPRLSAAAGWFAAVGALLGAVAGLVLYLLEPTFGPAAAAILAVAMLVVLTGALHVDGLADCADGLGVRGDRARRLTVMRDSAIGTFGAAALLLWLLLLVTAVAGVDRADGARMLIAAAALGRWSALVHARATPRARSDGLGAAFAPSPVALAAATVTALAAALLAAGPVHGLVSVAVALAVAGAVSAWSRTTLGGSTGDTLGAAVALAEVAVAVALLGLA